MRKHCAQWNLYWHPKCRRRHQCIRHNQKSLITTRKFQLKLMSNDSLVSLVSGDVVVMGYCIHFPCVFRYLKEFRTQQCPLFLQHKCTQHRPFTCFHWHFLNQRRRRPVRRRDGTFNYSPDAYCTKYDETTGICPEGDEWVKTCSDSMFKFWWETTT